MLLLLATQAYAEKVERLEGVHFGIGAGLWSSSVRYVYSDYLTQAVVTPSASVSARIRVSPAFTIEPIVSAAYDTEAMESGGDVIGTGKQTSLDLGLRLRPRVASAGNVDLVTIVGADYGLINVSTYDAEGEETFAGVANVLDAQLGLGLELWVLPRLSLGADLETSILEWSHEEARAAEEDKEVSESLAVGLDPAARVVVAFYL